MDIEEFFDMLCGDVKFDCEQVELDKLKEVTNNAKKVAHKINIHEPNRKDYTLAISIVFNYLIIPKDILYKLDRATYGNYMSAIDYLIRYISKVNCIDIKGMSYVMLEYDKHHVKSLDEMSKEELIAYIKEHNI